MDENETFSSFWGHVEELRRSFVQIFCIIIASVVLCFVFYEPLITFLKQPLLVHKIDQLEEEQVNFYRIHNHKTTSESILLPANSQLYLDTSQINLGPNSTYLLPPGETILYAKSVSRSHNLVVLSPLEGILIALKTSLWIGAFASSPIWLWIIAKFLLPGLYSHERKLIILFMITSLVFISLGCLFAYTITLPIANQYLQSFNATIGMNLWSLGNYLDYTLFLLMANGIAFEFGALGIFAVHLQYLSAETLIQNRRFAILGAFILAALLTPPDILTQFMLAIPLISLYEALILYAKMKRLRQNQNS
jgi:sec-independent protein translocase protein TatC